MKIARIEKILLVMIILGTFLLRVTYPAMAANNPIDVPSSHWAYKAVKLLIDKGYFQLYQDQTFQGDQPVDRYTMATITAKILGEIASGQTTGSKDDVKLLRSLTNEFREELVALNSKNNLFNPKLDNLMKENQILKEDLTTNREEQAQLRKEVQEIIAEIDSIKTEMQSLKEENLRLKVELERLRIDVDNKNKYIIGALVIGVIGLLK